MFATLYLQVTKDVVELILVANRFLEWNKFWEEKCCRKMLGIVVYVMIKIRSGMKSRIGTTII